MEYPLLIISLAIAAVSASVAFASLIYNIRRNKDKDQRAQLTKDFAAQQHSMGELARDLATEHEQWKVSTKELLGKIENFEERISKDIKDLVKAVDEIRTKQLVTHINVKNLMNHLDMKYEE
ncbi:MAG TPA: hypothetical protein PK916_08870 [Bacteroidota bacterium]|nr:hypothetical protein [Bacteroidota bacterium]